ncbi:MAG: threonine/serine exporter family protein, partial [Rikenellaceae bacterium]|nr:threonine/serine exporter family protein [Rikenellaceae bacterium]
MVLEVLQDALLSFFVAAGFAFLFETPLKAIPVAGILGGMGHCLRFILLSW